jgi:hypothetical protein
MAAPGGTSPCAKELAAAVPQKEFQQVEWPAIMDKLKEAKNQGLPFFQQGLTQYYGLNYEEAMRNFKEAKKDPRMAAIASWGIALAAGPNINLSMTDPCHSLATTEISCAYSLAGGEPQVDGCKKGGIITPLEKDLIGALQKRYAYPPGTAENAATQYSEAMADIWKNNKNDKNVRTLYAESMMDLHPWDLYDSEGLPKRNQTITIVDVLKEAIGPSQEAIGGNHYYIHAVEGSNPYKGTIHPVDALPSANWLQTQVPASGHLVHMSSHIYQLLGEYQESPQGPKINGYQKSLDVNIKGANDDVTQYGEACSGTYEMYMSNRKCPQLYYGHYLSHNYFFGSVSATFLGQSKKAIGLACDTQAHVQRFVAYEPGLQRYLAAPFMTMVVNRNWKEICDETCQKETTPPTPTFNDCYLQTPFEKGSPCNILRAIWYWARGTARLEQRRFANQYLAAMKKEIDKIPFCDETSRTAHNTFGNNCAKDVLDVGKYILEARMAWAGYGVNHDPAECKEVEIVQDAFGYLNCAVAAEDKLVYDEPPQWFTPAREALGGAYLRDGDRGASMIIPERRELFANMALKAYEMALIPFDRTIKLHPASGRALYGRMRALEGIRQFQKKDDVAGSKHVVTEDEVTKAKEDFCKAWGNADYTMNMDGLWPDNNSQNGNHPYICPGKEQLSMRPADPPSDCKLPAS